VIETPDEIVDRVARLIQAQIDGDLFELNGRYGLAFPEWCGERCANVLVDAGLLAGGEP
jgi:hypothetical protein